MNLKKSELISTQDLVYIGARFWMDLDRLYLPELRIQALITCVGSFSRVGAYKPAHQFLRLLGLMAATLQSVEYAHLHLPSSGILSSVGPLQLMGCVIPFSSTGIMSTRLVGG